MVASNSAQLSIFTAFIPFLNVGNIVFLADATKNTKTQDWIRRKHTFKLIISSS